MALRHRIRKLEAMEKRLSRFRVSTFDQLVELYGGNEQAVHDAVRQRVKELID